MLKSAIFNSARKPDARRGRLSCLVLVLLVSALPLLSGAVAAAAEPASVAAGELQKRSKALSGSWQIVEREGAQVLVLDDAFRARPGPDLKLFLSPSPFAAVTAGTALNGALLLGELKSNTGAQEYLVPAGTDLSNYDSVLVHCEKYAVLWGGDDLR